MTLASRLSTQANLGHMDTPKQKISIIVGNLTLIQVHGYRINFFENAFLKKLSTLRFYWVSCHPFLDYSHISSTI